MNFHVARARGIVNKTLATVALELPLTAAPELNIRTENDLPQATQPRASNLIERGAIKDSSPPEIFRETPPHVNDSEGRCLNATTSIKS
jgi:hypothetical protein